MLNFCFYILSHILTYFCIKGNADLCVYSMPFIFIVKTCLLVTLCPYELTLTYKAHPIPTKNTTVIPYSIRLNLVYFNLP